MSRASFVTVAFVLGTVVGAGAVLMSNRSTEQRIADLEESLAEARRDATDYDRVAQTERSRKELVEQENAELRQRLQSPSDFTDPPPPPTDAGHVSGRRELTPAEWDDRRLRTEVERLAMSGPRMPSSPLVDQCATAAKAIGDSAYAMLLDLLRVKGMPAQYVRAATLVLDRLGDPRSVSMLSGRFETETDPTLRRALLRALANVPGDDQVTILLGVWDDPQADPRLRLLAAHGLALRAHPTAVEIVRRPGPAADAAARARALESLHYAVRQGEYARKDLIAIFGEALLSADGEAQMRLAILALEGYWDPACVAPLRAFAELPDRPAVIAAQQERARGIAAAIEAGGARPDDAGTVRRPNEHVESAPPLPPDEDDSE